jgi:hypothetical protein
MALERLTAWGDRLEATHEIPPKLPTIGPVGPGVPAGVAEARLREMLRAAGFPEATWQQQIVLGHPLGSTTPDCFFPSDDPMEAGVCVYLDGLSRHIHGNPVTAARDRAIREELRARHYEVFEIAASDLDDRDAMKRHFFRLARVLLGRDKAAAIREQADWYRGPTKVSASVQYPEGSEGSAPDQQELAADAGGESRE